MAKKNALGRGLEAVFFENESTEQGPVSMLHIAELEPNPSQPRRSFDEEALGTLADSIRQNGIIQPIAVRPLGPAKDRYQIVAGERRWRAARLAGLSEVPVIVLELDDEHAAAIALIENLQREDLNPLEEARAYRELGERFSLSQEQIAQRVGKSRSAISNAGRLLDLPDDLLPLVENGSITAGHARAILSVAGEDRKALADLIVSLSLTVRGAEQAAKKLNEKRRRAAREAEKPGPTKEARMAAGYFSQLEERATRKMARRVLIHNDGRQKKVELYYDDNDDLEALLKTLCGADIFAE